MCLIMSFVSAAIFFAIWQIKKSRSLNSKNELTTALAFGAASLMWCVDGFSSLIGGESFFDFSREDFILGVIIVACGLALYGVLFLASKIKSNLAFSSPLKMS